jgi:hypothetical protein
MQVRPARGGDGRLRIPALTRPTQDAESRRLFRDQHAVAGVVALVAEEDEAGLAEPAQEVLDLHDLGPAVRQAPRRLLEVRHRLVQGVDHGAEVVRAEDHVLERLPDVLRHRPDSGGIADLGDLAVDQGLTRVSRRRRPQLHHLAVATPDHAQNRMEEPLDGAVPAREILPDGVHHERAFRDVRTDDRHRSVPGLHVLVRTHHFHVHAVRAGVLQVPERGQDESRRRLGGPSLEELRRCLGQVQLGETQDQVRLSRRDPAAEYGRNGFDGSHVALRRGFSMRFIHVWARQRRPPESRVLRPCALHRRNDAHTVDSTPVRLGARRSSRRPVPAARPNGVCFPAPPGDGPRHALPRHPRHR